MPDPTKEELAARQKAKDDADAKAKDDAARLAKEPPPVTVGKQYQVLHPCAYKLAPGHVVGRESFAPRAKFTSNEEREKATDEVIARLIGFGAIMEV